MQLRCFLGRAHHSMRAVGCQPARSAVIRHWINSTALVGKTSPKGDCACDKRMMWNWLGGQSSARRTDKTPLFYW